MTLKEIITQKITNSSLQKITFAEYMDLVLYHPSYGYYNSDNITIGTEGDFFTSSSLGSDFGELISIQWVEMWEILGKPVNFQLVEMGAGEGFLANDILACLSVHNANFLACLEYIIIEKSPRLITKQRANLQKWIDQGIKISWLDWSEIEDNSLVGCIFSNELIDAFPVHKLIKKEGKIQELYVSLDSLGNFQEVRREISTPKINNYFELLGINLVDSVYDDGYQTEVNLVALDWLKQVAIKLKQGYLVTIDYGYPADKYYHPQRSQGTLQCYFKHRYHSNPYVNLGEQDLTTHVNFTALEIQGKLLGLENIGLTKQALFLMNLGLGDKLTELSSGKYNLIEIMNRRDYLHQLINPEGLGGFGVLLQTKGLTSQQKETTIKGFKDF